MTIDVAQIHCRASALHETRIEALEALPPVERVEGMARLLSDPRRWAMESALRRWAQTDESIANSVDALDCRIFSIAISAMRELGFSEAEAHAAKRYPHKPVKRVDSGIRGVRGR